jgi:hypothetical protein
MKTIYTLLLLFISTLSFSQNWNLVNQNKSVFFKHSDSTNITNTIVIDSNLINGSNTNYYTGYAFKYCDTCQGFNYYEPIIYRYAKELLGFIIEDDVTNNQYNLDNNTIKQHSQVNDNWAFNTSLNATLINTTEQLILGVLDSIKIIHLSNTDTIIISKNYGIIRYPDFKNAGKYFEMVGYHEGQNSFGDYLPNFWRTYDFNVGDKLSYHEFYSEQEYYIITVTTFEILTKEIIGDTLKFISKKLSTSNLTNTVQFDQEPTTYQNYIVNSTSVNHTNNFENSFGVNNSANHSFTSGNLPGGISISQPGFNTPLLHGARFVNDPIFGLVKQITTLTAISDSLYKSRDITYNIGQEEKIQYGNSKGLLKDGAVYLGPAITTQLIGTIINGDTTGTVYSFPDDLGFEQNTIANTLEFYPNPAHHDIIFKTELAILKIYSITGQLVMSIKKPIPSINISHLKKGLYYLKGIDIESNSVNSKLIIN